MGPQGFWGSGENGYLFSGSWGALVIILGELGSKLMILEIKGALPKSKKNKEKPPFFFFNFFCFGGLAPQTPLVTSKCIYFCTNMLIMVDLGEIWQLSCLLDFFP